MPTGDWGCRNLAAHVFGGPDTSRKLRCLQEYLQAFSIALRNQQFACVYIDAFAGSGTRTEVRPGLPLFGPDFAEPEEITTPGSARIAIEIDPPMHSVVLIEQDTSRFSELQALVDMYPDRKIIPRNGDANKLVGSTCRLLVLPAPLFEKERGIGIGALIEDFVDPLRVHWTCVGSALSADYRPMNAG